MQESISYIRHQLLTIMKHLFGYIGWNKGYMIQIHQYPMTACQFQLSLRQILGVSGKFQLSFRQISQTLVKFHSQKREISELILWNRKSMWNWGEISHINVKFHNSCETPATQLNNRWEMSRVKFHDLKFQLLKSATPREIEVVKSEIGNQNTKCKIFK